MTSVSEKRAVVCAVRNPQNATVIHRLKDERPSAENDYATAKLLAASTQGEPYPGCPGGDYGDYIRQNRNNSDKEPPFYLSTFACCHKGGGSGEEMDAVEYNTDQNPRDFSLQADYGFHTLPASGKLARATYSPMVSRDSDYGAVQYGVKGSGQPDLYDCGAHTLDFRHVHHHHLSGDCGGASGEDCSVLECVCNRPYVCQKCTGGGGESVSKAGGLYGPLQPMVRVFDIPSDTANPSSGSPKQPLPNVTLTAPDKQTAGPAVAE